MASGHAFVSDGASRIGIGYCNDGSGLSGSCDIQDSKDLGDDLLHDLDSYLEDINDRLTISRMVSDSIIKGMVNAVSQEATEVVAAKELEVARLKEVLCHQQRGNSEINASVSWRKNDDLQLQAHGVESLGLLNLTIQDLLDRLGQCIADIKGLDVNLKESLFVRNDFDEAFNFLNAMLKAICQQVDSNAYSAEFLFEEWKMELDIRKEVEATVFCTVVQGLQVEYEQRLWNVNNVLALIDRFNEISSLRHELDAIQKCFVGPEAGNLSPQGSIEMDHFHRKVLPSAQLWDGNGKCEESKVSMPENLETSPLKHMSAQDLYQHFKTVITEMKREHESTVQQMTEEYFTLKRELLKERELVKERGPFVAFKKDKDYEILRKKIPEVIVKLDGIVRDNEKLSKFCSSSRETLDSLLTENHRLKELLNRQKQEVHCFSLQASDATKKLLQHSLAEENMQKLVGDLKYALQDEHNKASISEEVYKCIMREMAALVNSSFEDLDLKSIILQDIFGTIYEEVLRAVDVSSKSDYEENIDMQSSMIQQIYGIIFQEVVGHMSMELNELKDKSVYSLQEMVSEIENKLRMKVEENEELRHQVLVLENSIKQKDKIFLDDTALLEKERAQFTEELNKLICENRNQEAQISDQNIELVLLKDKLEDLGKQIEKLNSALQLSEDKLRKSDEEKANLKLVLQHKQNYFESIKAKDSEHTKHMEFLCHAMQGLSKSFADFDLRIKESIRWHSVRLENSVFQLHALIPKINVLRRTGSLYKERLEKRCSDLQKAEAEVDLLGDEVDALLSLLEKIYVALDHYSPILQHYPGIIEILELVKRELSGEAAKAV